MKVKIEKISPCEKPNVETAEKENYRCGDFNSKSPFVGYTVIGTLLRPLATGDVMLVDRDERNGEKVNGYFHSSLIKTIERISDDGKVVRVSTENSVYKITFLD